MKKLILKTKIKISEGENNSPLHFKNGMRNTNIIQSVEDRCNENLKIYFKEISRFKTLKPKEEKALFLRFLDGDTEAGKMLINSNLKLVVSIAKKYQGYGLPLLDLIQEGNNGLVLSMSHYDMTKKTRFSTCASWWIKYSIKKAINDVSRTLRVPANQYNNYRKIMKAVASFEQEYERLPYPEEISEMSGIKENKVIKIMKQANLVTPMVIENEDGKIECDYSTLIPDDCTEKEIESNSLKDFVNVILSKLSPREEMVLRQIFGIDCIPMAIKDIAEANNLTYERIRQIKKSALAKLKQRYPNLWKELIDK